MLTKAQKSAWIEALRSGKYRQTQRGEVGFQELKSESGYCCLGVLAELNGWSTDRAVLDNEGATTLSASDYDISAQNGCLVACGLPQQTKEFTTLAMMNDHGMTFAEIADFLEKYLPTKD